ncbi:hypothetical protein RD149_19900 [Gordonia westfalica]|uniref:Glycosyl hydrolase family 26 n=1 Tax=Gordonia westfalica TaxID=158898 RepID=A0ABU2GX45_9ACTN|nr:hypothetical protein [Gordonia westfalica]MDS1116015.1 hypothetical protein [Gordonia westfalica]
MALGTLAVPMSACASDDPVESPQHKQAWGAFLPRVQPVDAGSASPIAQLAALAGQQPRYLHCFAAIGDSAPTADLTAIAVAGATPLLTLEPWRPGAGTDQPSYAMARFAGGDFDAELRRWGSELSSWGRPVFLRFAQEMNGTWYPWSIGVNGDEQPILITEVASADGPQDDMKARWIRDFFEIVRTQDRLAGFLWFQMDKERDWRFNSTAASTSAFRTGLETLPN